MFKYLVRENKKFIFSFLITFYDRRSKIYDPVVDLGRVELPTSSLQMKRYNQLSHRPLWLAIIANVGGFWLAIASCGGGFH